MTNETVKKTPAKSKTAVKTQTGEPKSAGKAAPTVAGKSAAKGAKAETIDVEAVSAPTYGEIAQLAERYWAERGWQDGYAEQDWLRAERELVGVAS